MSFLLSGGKRFCSEVDPPRYADLSALRYRDFSRVQGRIEQAHVATADYLRQLAPTEG